MNYTLLGLSTFTLEGVQGAIFLMIAHGFISPALFMLIGFIYSRYHSRLITYYSGLQHYYPILSSFFFFFYLQILDYLV